MKTRLGFFPLLLFVLMGLTFCEKPKPEVVSLAMQGEIKFHMFNHKDNDSLETDDDLHWYFNPDLTYGSISDIDGNIYRTIQIGSQTWMAENLKTTRYNDGTQIPNIIDNSTWITLKTGAYRWYNNDKWSYKNLYGALYNWYTVKTGKLCPSGWHVPSDDDWKQLEMTLGMTKEEVDSWGEFPGIDSRGTDQGIQMKAAFGWITWEGSLERGTNSSGFTALPAGESDWSGWSSGGPLMITSTKFRGAGICTTWWESTSEGGGRAVVTSEKGVIRGVYPAICGCSVRCLKD